MEQMFESSTQIVMTKIDHASMTLKDLRHTGVLVITCSEDASIEAVKDELDQAFKTGNLLLRLKGINQIIVSEGMDLTGAVSLHDVSLTDPILENADLYDVNIPHVFLTVRFANLERVGSHKRMKKIFLAYGLYDGGDLIGDEDINMINRVRIKQ